MKAPSRTWPDGRPVGGMNGYPPEFHEYTLHCQAVMVVRLMRGRPRNERESIFREWEKLPGVTRERIHALWPKRGEL